MKITFYDANPGTRLMDKFLKLCWFIGCWLQKLFGVVDAYYGVTNFDTLRKWLEYWKVTHPDPVTSVQYWGHGGAGTVWISGKPTYSPHWHELHGLIQPGGLLWFRCCSVFQGEHGHRFAKSVSSALGCRVAAHTRVIGVLQGGLHSIGPGEQPSWPVEEGELPPGLLRDLGLKWGNNTIFCLATKVPSGW